MSTAAPAVVSPNRSGQRPVQAFLGIHDGHNASVALVRNGKLEFALQEERLTRVKNQGDVPVRALRQAQELVGDEPVQVALNGRYMHYGQWDRETILRDYERSGSWSARLKQPLKDTIVDRFYQNRLAAERFQQLQLAGLDKVTAVEHHQAHAAAAYYTAPWRKDRSSFPDRTLVFTCDGSGDRLSATVSVGEGASLTRLAQVSEHDSIGRLYSLITRFLGMVPLEHEYKVMGLAPYASAARESAEVARLLSELFELQPDNLTWRRKAGVPSMYAAYGFLERLLAGRRFDHIAAGVQAFLEQILVRWVRAAVCETGISRIACSGGVFMNVKANMALLEADGVEEMYVAPSCGDESNSIGAACWQAAQANQPVAPLEGLYFGDALRDDTSCDVLENAARAGARISFHWETDIERRTAEALARGQIVARAKGPSEFGARALGNRSILARPDAPGIVRVINEAIKSRDFWMPFAPSVLAERVDRYYVKPKPVLSPYMMFAFRARPERAAVFAAAQHPYDRTARPQEVTAEHNASYHRLLQHYEGLTGEGIVLNTSFNLHGEPIVDSPADALTVLLRSGLKYLALGNWWVEKRA